MRIAYLDCFAGIAGDMMLGALLDAGVPLSVLEEAIAALNIGVSLRIECVDRSGISATKVHVLDGRLAEAPNAHTHEHAHPHTHPTNHEPHHEAGSLAHPHAHGRSLTQIRTLINAAPLADPVKHLGIRTFELLGASEARIHKVPVDDIHFHEVGAVDAIIDIVASSAGIHHLQIGAWHSSPINVGSGKVHCAHGNFPVPAPATADLLRNVPTYSAHLQKELTTPTGAALIRALAPTFGPQPGMRVEHIGYGAGTRNPAGFPNVLRLLIGESAAAPYAWKSQNSVGPAKDFVISTERADPAADSVISTEGATHPHNSVISTEAPEPRSGETCISAATELPSAASDTVNVLETALDDASPQLLAYVAEKALTLGALDVMLAPVIMKKGRPGTLLTVLTRPNESDRIAHLLLRETTTLGLRIRHEQRLILDREILTVDTPYGPIRLKRATDPATGDLRNLAPEYEDCRAAAEQHNVPLKIIQQAALAAASLTHPKPS